MLSMTSNQSKEQGRETKRHTAVAQSSGCTGGRSALLYYGLTLELAYEL